MNYIQYLVITYKGQSSEKEKKTCITQPLCCTLETLDQLFFNKINKSWNSTNLELLFSLQVQNPATCQKREPQLTTPTRSQRRQGGRKENLTTLTTHFEKPPDCSHVLVLTDHFGPHPPPLLPLLMALRPCGLQSVWGPASLCENADPSVWGSPLPFLSSLGPGFPVILRISVKQHSGHPS